MLFSQGLLKYIVVATAILFFIGFVNIHRVGLFTLIPPTPHTRISDLSRFVFNTSTVIQVTHILGEEIDSSSLGAMINRIHMQKKEVELIIKLPVNWKPPTDTNDYLRVKSLIVKQSRELAKIGEYYKVSFLTISDNYEMLMGIFFETNKGEFLIQILDQVKVFYRGKTGIILNRCKEHGFVKRLDYQSCLSGNPSVMTPSGVPVIIR